MKHTTHTLSAIIIAKNEEKMLSRCLSSLNFVDEIVIIDTGSTDKTVSIAKTFTSHIYSAPEEATFSDWRSFGAKHATGEWILFIDADEQVTDQLKKEILDTISTDTTYVAFAIPRRNNLLGHDMKWGGWWPDYVLRLIKKKYLKGYVGDLHEQPVIDGAIGKLISPFIHTTHRNLSSMIDKTNQWSEIEARLMFDAHHPPMTIPRFFTAIFREFWNRGIVHLGFLDGYIGIIEIIFQMFSRFISYSKLWELQTVYAMKQKKSK